MSIFQAPETPRPVNCLPRHTIIDNLAYMSIEGSGWQRFSKIPVKRRHASHATVFDSFTLWYDAVWNAGWLFLVCPKLSNLERLFRCDNLRLDGIKARKMEVCNYFRHSVVRIKARSPPSEIQLKLDGRVYTSGTNAADREFFNGLNAEILVSKDNRLEWIEDHVRFHVETHGLEAVCFIDNGSRSYSLSDISETLKVSGVARSCVVSAPFPFGPINERPFRHSELFLQTAMYNVARLRFLYSARAVLLVDVDEVVFTTDGETIFDKTCQSLLGFRRFSGYMRYTAPGQPRPRYHADHYARSRNDRAEAPKWCLCPSGLLRNFQWRPHNLENFRFGKLFLSKDAGFYHCAAVNTGWKSRLRGATPERMVPDLETREDLSIVSRRRRESRSDL